MRIEDISRNLIRIDSLEFVTEKRKEKTILKRFRLATFFSLIFLILLSSPIKVPIAVAEVTWSENAGTVLSVEPMEYTAAPGETFTINVNIINVTNMQGYEFKLGFNTTLLNVTGSVFGEPAGKVVAGPVNPPGTMYGPMCTDPNTGFPTWCPLRNITQGFVWAGAALPFGSPFTGTGTLMTINFTALAVGNSTLRLYDTALKDPMAGDIPHTWHDGEVTVTPIAVHDIAITSVTASPTTVTVGEPVSINVTVVNEGNVDETFDVSVYYDSDPIETQTGITLSAGATTTLTFAWDTTGVSDGTYTIKAEVPPVPEEVDVADNVFIDGVLLCVAQGGDYHDDHLNDPTDAFPNDYAPMVIPVNGKSVTIAPVITCTTFLEDVFKPYHYPCKSAQTLFVDDDWNDKDASYTYLFEDWTDYDWNDIVVSLYTVTNDIAEVEIRLEDREAAWKNPFSVEITPEGLTVDVHWNSTDYPGDHIVRVNPNETVDIELFAESNPGDTAFITIIPTIPPVASFVYSPPHPRVCEDVTFNASASTPDGGYIVSYEWDFGDGGLHGFGVVVTHHYSSPGTYNVTLNVTDSEGRWDTESKMITVTPRTYTLTITSTSGGTTDPVPGSYSYNEGTVVLVTAFPDTGYVFDHWELDSINVGSVTSTSVTMDKDHTLHAVFKEAPPPCTVGGHALPIDKSRLLAPKIGLVSWIGLVLTFLAAMAATVILIKRRNNTF